MVIKLTTLFFLFSISSSYAAVTTTHVDINANTKTVAQYNQLLNAPNDSKIYAGIELLKNGNEEYDIETSGFRVLSGHYPYIYGWHFDFLSLQPTIATTLSTHAKNGGMIDIVFNGQSAGVNLMTNGARIPDVRAGGQYRTQWLVYLDAIAAFFDSIQDDSGNRLPILFRMFLEFDLSGFWWNCPTNNSCTDFISLWQETVIYLRDTKGLHNIIYVWQPNDYTFATAGYPGDDYVDVIGTECYDTSFNGCLTGHDPFHATATAANTKNKPWIISEFGNVNLQTGAGFIESYWTTISSDLFNATFAKMPSALMMWSAPSYGPIVGRADSNEFQSFITHEGITLLDYSQKKESIINNAIIKNWSF